MIYIMNFFQYVFRGGGDVEMDRGGVLTHGKRQCAYYQYLNLPTHSYRLISYSFSPFRVSKKRDSD